MPDEITRKRLKKKVLDRWENEGGSLSADQAKQSEIASLNERSRESDVSPAKGSRKIGKPEDR